MRKKSNVSKSKAVNSKAARSFTNKSREAKSSNRKSDHVSGGNDPSWYNLDPALTRDAANFPYSIPAGSPICTHRNWSLDVSSANPVPGVLAVELTPTVGYAWNPEDPINMASQQMYSFITHANSRNTSYDAADLMQYFLATAEVYSYVEFLKRAYGVARLFSYDNKYMPDAILRAMHIDSESVRYNMADFRLGLNMLINKLATFAVPNSMSIFARKQFMYSGLYTDSDSVKDQVYMFVPGAFYYWDWKNATLKSLKFKEMYDKLRSYGMAGSSRGQVNPYTASELIEMGNFLINAIMHNTDMGTMNGDVLKAYGNNILTVSTIDETYTVIPSVNVGVLEQIQNAIVVPNILNDSLDITSAYITTGSQEGTSILESVPTMADMPPAVTDGRYWYDDVKLLGEFALLSGKHVIQTRVDNPDPPYNMEITRLVAGLIERNIARPDLEGEGEEEITKVLICGTEIVTNIYMYDTLKSNPFQAHNVYLDVEKVIASQSDINWFKNSLPYVLKQDRQLFGFKSFKFAPTVYLYNASELLMQMNPSSDVSYKAPDDIPARRITINTTKYTTLGNADLDNMHRVAVMSEFYVPKVSLK